MNKEGFFMDKNGNYYKGELKDGLAEGEGDQELISEKLRSGYYYEGELIRPAMVKVKKQ